METQPNIMGEDKAIEVHEVDGDVHAESPSTTQSARDWKSMTMAMMSWMRGNLLLVLTLVAVIIGMTFGGALRYAKISDTGITVIGLPGAVLVRLLKMLILPLIVSSLITGLTSMDTKSSGKLGARAIVYYICTTCIAVIIGIIVVVTIGPGRGFDEDKAADIKVKDRNDEDINTLDSVVDILRNLFPQNLIQACFQQAKTDYTQVMKFEKNDALSINVSKEMDCSWDNATDYGTCNSVTKGTKGFKNGMNMLGILIFTIPFGILLNRMGERGRVMVDFFQILSEITMQLVNMVMWYSPIGIMSLICSKILSMQDLDKIVPSLGLYMLAVILGLVIHLGVLMTIFYAVTRRNPLVFFEGIIQAWATAFATASSGATLPVTIRCLEENLKIDERVTRFVLPIGATVNMDGTALYEAVAAIFIGQMHGSMGFGKIIQISLIATLGSIGAASIPSAGIVTLVLVLSAVGLPVDDIGLLMAVDWLLDRCRTSINVVGDSYGAGIVYHLSQKELNAADKEEAEMDMEAGESKGGSEGGDAIQCGKAEIVDENGVEDIKKKEENLESGV